MNEEYLWDKSGEPDPEIQQLEQILGTLRYQPKTFEVPTNIRPARRYRYLGLAAIAATLLFTLLAGIAWRSLHRKQAELPVVADSSPKSLQPAGTPEVVTPPEEKTAVINKPVSQPRRHEFVAQNAKRRTNTTSVASPEALLAKEQLMTALRLASEKINLAQRRTQGPAQPNQIRNQHKLG
jgi:hypothetical protein